MGPVPARPRRVLIRMNGTVDRIQPREQGMRDGFEELGCVRRENIVFTQFKEVGYDHLRAATVSCLRKEKLDLIVALGTTERLLPRM